MFLNLHPERQQRAKPSFFKPVLEELEPRQLLTAGAPVAAIAESSNTHSAPPSLFQAVLSLYLDGAYLQTKSLLQQYANPATIDFPSAMANNSAAAAAAGINVDAVKNLFVLLGNTQTDLNLGNDSSSNSRALGVMDDLQFNWQYAGLFAPYAVAAGMQAALQAVQQ